MTRISRDQLFMEMALLFAERGTCPRARVGAVIVQDRHVISHGYNGSPPSMPQCDEVGCGGKVTTCTLDGDEHCGVEFPNGCTRTVHAEANAVAYAGAHQGGLTGATMYTTHQPCLPCAQLILSARITKVIYLEPYRLKEGLELLQASPVEVVKYEQQPR
jgi:dCMP deaminase